MNIKTKLVTGMGALLLAVSAQASLIVSSIDVAMVKSDFNPRTAIPGFVPVDIAAVAAGLAGFAEPWSDPANRLCNVSLDVFENISSSETCGGPNRNVGTLFTITGSSTGPALLEFGLDWGRGGFTMLNLAESGPQFTRHNSDIWWKRNWNHGDVFNLIIPETSEFLLVGLGFEGCCDGDSSIRWRSLLGAGPISTFSQEPDVGVGEWQALAVNEPVAVPEPAMAYLLGIGLLGLAYSRKGQTRNRELVSN